MKQPADDRKIQKIKDHFGWAAIRIDSTTGYVYVRRAGVRSWQFIADSRSDLIRDAEREIQHGKEVDRK